ncbi:MAG: hypothetical protein ACRYG2_05090 [Janthinobacterium lividum]
MSSSMDNPRTPDDAPRTTNTDTTSGSATGAGPSGTAASAGTVQHPTGRDLVRQQKDRFGGMKFGACFFGWLTATGTAVLLSAVLTAVGLAVGRQQDLTAAQASGNAGKLGVASAIVLLVVILVAYYCGGYVAGRMARFNGLRQGVGVWLWTIIAAVVVTILGLVAGNRFNALSSVNSLPSLPVSGDALTTGAIISIVVVIVAALVGAVLGGLAGMRYHRRIDRATFTD